MQLSAFFFLPLIRSLIIDKAIGTLGIFGDNFSSLLLYPTSMFFFPSIRKKNFCTFGQHFVHPAASVNTILIPVCV